MASKLNRVHVGNLNIGEFVESVEIGTQTHPTLWHRYIHSLDDINELSQLCRYLWVDENRTQSKAHAECAFKLAANY